MNVASAGQHPIDFADPMLEHHYDGVTAYRRSKLAQIMSSFDLADELRGEVTVNSLHPASFMDTTMVHEAGTTPRSTVTQGSDATLRLITGPASRLSTRGPGQRPSLRPAPGSSRGAPST
ncbi:hypothetical protein WEI85_27050 [Actinomycetes bacterium KLBMP 9797]